MSICSKRRVLLYVPGSNQRMLDKSLSLGADGIIYDLEDSVSPTEKEAARFKVTEKLRNMQGEIGNIEIIVRINSFDTTFAFDDLLEICKYPPDAIIITKAAPKSMIVADQMIGMLEMKYEHVNGSIKIIPLVETAIGVEKVTDILAASNRIVAVQFGAEDFTRDMGIARRADNIEISYARKRLALACRASGVDCIDTPYTDFSDVFGCEEDTRFVKAIGMTGRTVIHPSLIELTKVVFSPTAEEIEEARQMIEAFENGKKEGRGAIVFKGRMIDEPIVDRARQLC